MLTTVLTLSAPLGASASGSVTEYLASAPTAQIENIVAGPDGALWYTELNTGKVGRITTAGQFTEYPVPGDPYNTYVVDIAAGADGALWFTVQGASPEVGRITTSGDITLYPVPRTPDAITAGSDGALWFGERYGTVGRIATDGSVTEYPTGTNGFIYDITAGPDGALWFTVGGGHIGRISTSGSVTLFPASSFALSIAAGPDGALWFTDAYPGSIDRMTTDGTVTVFPTDTSPTFPFGITAGPDGAMWFTDQNANLVGRITMDGTITDEFPVPTASSAPHGITTGPDGAMWFAEFAGSGLVGRVDVPPRYKTSGNCDGAPGHAVLQPINANNSSVFKLGSTVPVKFRVCDANDVSVGPTSVFDLAKGAAPVLYSKTSGVGGVDEAVYSTTPDSSFRWDPNARQWVFNQSTKNLVAGVTYTYRIYLNDGTYIQYTFGVK